MGATSVTGTGPGASDKPNLADLSIAAIGPQIMAAGTFPAVGEEVSSPFAANGTVILPIPLPGGIDKYVVFLTGILTGNTFVTQKIEEDGEMTGFVFGAEAEGDVMYLVVKAGFKPSDLR